MDMGIREKSIFTSDRSCVSFVEFAVFPVDFFGFSGGEAFDVC